MLTVDGIHHLKIAVSDLDRSLDFYHRVFDAERIPAADHRHTETGALYAYILHMPGWGTYLELRLNPPRAQRHSGFNALTLSVADRAALLTWSGHLEACEVRHSGIITGMQAWMIALEDPDRQQLRLYTQETHGPELTPDEHNAWIIDE